MTAPNEEKRHTVDAFIDSVVDLGNAFRLSSRAGDFEVEKSADVNEVRAGDSLSVVASDSAIKAGGSGDDIYIKEEGVRLFRDNQLYAFAKFAK